MSQGIPAIASPLPSYEELINKTRGGIIARTTAEWRTALTEIQHDKTLLRRMGEAAYSGMREFSTEAVVEQYLELFNTLFACHTRDCSH